jgi:hypothetical protein
MYMTHGDLHIFYHQVHQNVARKFDVEDYEWKSTSELAEEIQTKNSQVAHKVNEFIEAYEAWFKVHENIEASDSAGNLSTEENAALMMRIDDRDSTRKALIDELAKL